jgi:hypothetical protein
MRLKDIRCIDVETGEILGQFPAMVGRKIVSPYREGWMQLNQEALAEIAADRDMGTEAFRVFLYLNSRLDFENLILVPQTDMAAALGMKRQAIGRAVKLLADKQIILRGPKIGSMSSYRLNERYGWKGKVKNFPKEQKPHLQVVEIGGSTTEPDTKEDTP